MAYATASTLSCHVLDYCCTGKLPVNQHYGSDDGFEGFFGLERRSAQSTIPQGHLWCLRGCPNIATVSATYRLPQSPKSNLMRLTRILMSGVRGVRGICPFCTLGTCITLTSWSIRSTNGRHMLYDILFDSESCYEDSLRVFAALLRYRDYTLDADRDR